MGLLLSFCFFTKRSFDVAKLVEWRRVLKSKFEKSVKYEREAEKVQKSKIIEKKIHREHKCRNCELKREQKQNCR